MVSYDADKDEGWIGHAEPSNLPDTRFPFQHGPIQDNGVNGIQNEEVIELLIIRLRALNERFPCRENSLAITKLEEAQMWLDKRTALRQEQNVEGKNEAHKS